MCMCPILGTMSTASSSAAKRKGSPGEHDDDPQAQGRKRSRYSVPDLPKVRNAKPAERRGGFPASRSNTDIHCQPLYFNILLELWPRLIVSCDNIILGLHLLLVSLHCHSCCLTDGLCLTDEMVCPFLVTKSKPTGRAISIESSSLN